MSHKSSWPRVVALLVTCPLWWPRASAACGVCVTAALDRVLPLISLWSLLGVGWFLATAVVADVTRQKLPWLPSPGRAFVYIVVCVLLGVVAFGPLLVLLLFVPSLIALVYAWKAGRGPGWLPCKIIGSLGLVATLGLGGYSALLYSRTPTEYILQWESTYPAYAAMHALQAHEPASLPVYRQLVMAGKAWTTAQAAARLGEIGAPETDVPLLLIALQRVRVLKRSADEVRQVEAALERLSGLHLPPESPPAAWTARWLEREFP